MYYWITLSATFPCNSFFFFFLFLETVCPLLLWSLKYHPLLDNIPPLPQLIENTVYNFPLLKNDFTLFFFFFLPFLLFFFFFQFTISYLNNLYTQTNRNNNPVTSIYKVIHIKEAEIVKLQKDLVNQKHSWLSVPDFDVTYMAVFLPFFKALIFFFMCKKHIFRGYDHVKIVCNNKTDIALDMFVLQ